MAGKEIPINDLSLPQLNHLSQQLEQEIEFLQNSLSSLKMVQGKFTESKESLATIVPANADKDILVPLTSSMYVPGKLADFDDVLIDIGTGYYVEKTIPQAKDYFSRRIDYLTSQMEKLQPALQEKYKMKQAIMEIVQMKVQAQLAAQGGSPSTSKA